MKLTQYKHIALLLYMLLLKTTYGLAVTAFFKQYDVTDGLFNNQARSIIEMPDHRILVQTEGMFNLYDGNSFKQLEYDKTKTISLQSFLNVNSYFDRQQHLWIKDNHNLFVIDTRTYKFLRPSDFFQTSGIHSVFENFFIDTDGNAWITTEDCKLYFYDFHHRAHLIFHIPRSTTRANHIVVTDIVKANSRYYIFTSDGWMRCLDKSRTKVLYCQRIETQKLGFRIQAHILNNRFILIRRCNGLFKYDVISHTMSLIIKNTNISEFFCCNNGEVWVSSSSGIYHLDRNQKIISKLDDIKESRLGRTIRDSWLGLTIDYQGGLWLCSFNNGVMYYNSKSAMTSSYKNSSADADANSFRSIINYDNNHVYAASFNGLFLFNRFTHTYTNIGGKLSHIKGKSITKDSKGNLWIATYQEGLYCYHPASGAVNLYGTEFSKDGTDFSFCEEAGNGVYLVCYDKNRLALFYPATNKYHLISDKFQKLYDYRYMVCACRISDGFIIGTQNGLFFYNTRDDKVDFKKFAILDNNKYSNKCNYIITDRTGRIWVGTQNGLLCYDEHRKSLRRYSSTDGLPNSCVQSMVEDKRGNMWITTTNGMVKMTSVGGEMKFLTLDKQDGIYESCFNERSLCSVKDILYFGTTNGIYEVNPARVSFPKTYLIPCITDIFMHSSESTLNGLENIKEITNRLSRSNELRLHYDENFITIGISALNYLFPSHTIYRYQLEGIDQHPINVGGKEGKISVSYTSLPPGNYKFVVQAAIFGQPWGKPVTIDIHIAPPFWLSWWAILIYVIVTLSISLYILNEYIKFRNSKLELEQKERARLEREKLDEMKFRFFTNISHEFRTPLTLIITPLQTLLSRTDIPKEVCHTLDVIQRSAHSLNALVTQLLDFRSLENHGEVLQPSMIQIGTLLNSVKKTFDEMAKERNIHFTVTGNAFNASFCLDLPKMQKIINNLLSNAFKFTGDGGRITLKADIDDQKNTLKLSVQDSGIGIRNEDIDNIFNRFYQGENVAPNSPLNTGSGIGLNLVKGYVDLHQGKISVNSEEGKGTCFNIEIPNHLQTNHIEKDVLREDNKVMNNTIDTEPTSITDNHKVRLLIVEDNTDFRDFMTETLGTIYHIDTASDGMEAIEMLQDIDSELIISDVMMPKMNGFQLCSNIKNDFKLSHIPVILLTAENSDEGREDGYKSGADSYITKPFNMNVLQVRINQLLEQREQRKKLFSKEVNVSPKEITISPLDEKIMSKAIECIEKNINNADYGVEAFSRDMAMERSNLYRKMLAIVGKTPSEFIRSIRLKRAAQLLKTKNYSVLDVSVMVGFNTMKYFTQHFKEEFGVTPSQYKE
jgi:signal transduction histidine kinase/DNA-binding response OmpR family regulator/ligand-binding sensor domain-containing protein